MMCFPIKEAADADMVMNMCFRRALHTPTGLGLSRDYIVFILTTLITLRYVIGTELFISGVDSACSCSSFIVVEGNKYNMLYQSY